LEEGDEARSRDQDTKVMEVMHVATPSSRSHAPETSHLRRELGNDPKRRVLRKFNDVFQALSGLLGGLQHGLAGTAQQTLFPEQVNLLCHGEWTEGGSQGGKEAGREGGI
jgi:hypothetical protein